MNQVLCSKVDDYISDRLLPPDAALSAALAANAAAGLPAIDVSPPPMGLQTVGYKGCDGFAIAMVN